MCMKHEIEYVSNVCVVSLVGLDEIPRLGVTWAVLSFPAFSMPSMMPQEWRSELYAICRFQATNCICWSCWIDSNLQTNQQAWYHQEGICVNMTESFMFTWTPMRKDENFQSSLRVSVCFYTNNKPSEKPMALSGPAFGTKLRRVRITSVRLNEVHESILSRKF